MRCRFFGMLVPLMLLAGSAAPAQDREARPAVVHPVVSSNHREVMSLDGEWEFAVDPEGKGRDEQWYQPGRKFPGAVQIQVPGCWEAQGIGDPGASRPTTPERAVFPLKGSYVGSAWYRKRADLPADWEGKRIWLKIGGVNAQGWFWVNGGFVAHVESYCGSYKYDVTDLVKAGDPVTVAALVRNDVLSGKGLFNWQHRFGGLYRSVELDATSDPCIDYAYVEGDWDARTANVRVTVLKTATAAGTGGLRLRVEVKDPTGAPAGSAEVSFAMRSPCEEKVLQVSLDPFLDWSPAYPNLYKADIALERDGLIIDGWAERFGVRKLEIRGSDFYLNGRRFYMRAYGDDHIYPLTLRSPASHKAHRRNLETARSFGFNLVRHHTHCEIPEFYEMADEIGIMVQPELPYYGPRASAYGGRLNAQDERFFRPREDLEELIRHYRRHASLSVYCTGNEGHLGSPMDEEIYRLAKGLDPTRWFLHQDGGWNRENNSDFDNLFEWQWEPEGPAAADDRKRPLTLHEYLNLAVDIDPRLSPRYTGAVLPPRKLEAFKRGLEKQGIPWTWAEACLDSGKRLQKVYQKLGLERARKDPRLDGYVYWTICDVDCFSSQGLLDPFWEPKAMRLEEFRKFNCASALLADPLPGQAVHESGQVFEVAWSLSHFSAEDIRAGRLLWRLGEGEDARSGELPGVEAPSGKLSALGASRIVLPVVKRPTHMVLHAELAGTGIENDWDLWIFPRLDSYEAKASRLAASDEVYARLKDRCLGLTRLKDLDLEKAEAVLADRMDARVLAALHAGKPVLLLGARGLESVRPGVKLGWWGPGTQTGTAIAEHPAWGELPHDGYLSPVFFRLVQWAMPADRELMQADPLMLGSGKDGYVVHAFAARVGRGKLLAAGLDLLSEAPEARYLLQQFSRCVKDPGFQPEGMLSPEVLKRFEAPNGWRKTVRSSGTEEEHRSYRGPSTLRYARQTDGTNEVVWETAPLPSDLPGVGMCALRWIAATGYRSQPPGTFTLYLGNRALLDFDVSLESRTWASEDKTAVLEYEVKDRDGEDSSGVMTLKVPCAWLIPGEPVILRVTGSASNSRRWFGVYDY